MHPAPTLATRTPVFMLRVRGLLLNDGEGTAPGAARGHPWWGFGVKPQSFRGNA